jgi:IclR family KDG regulon transcriptional repressor
MAYLDSATQQQIIDSILHDKSAISFTKNTITDSNKLIKELNLIKKQGYALDREEFELGLICLAVPIFNQNNEVVASLSASGPANRFEENKVSDYVATLQKGAEAIKHKIGFFKP